MFDLNCNIFDFSSQKRENQEKSLLVREDLWVKGILPQTNFYRPNLIFWIEMECGNARFGMAKKHLKLKILVSKFVPWDLEATHT